VTPGAGRGTDAYEGLRAWATGEPCPGPRPPGLALLLRFGVAAWLAAGAAPARRPPARATPPAAGGGRGPGPPAAAVVAGLTLVLAAMVAACHPAPAEGRP
jgi:hypothetical protein